MIIPALQTLAQAWLPALMLLVVSSSYLAPGFVPSALADRSPVRFRKGAMWASGLALSFALASAVWIAWKGPITVVLFQVSGIGLSLYADSLSVMMLLLVSFLGVVIVRYSTNYLDGDPRQGTFIKWLCLTIAAVLFLVVAGTLLQFFAGWVATSLCLHQLLTFYRERPEAIKAARKKFIISRLGDACLLASLVLAWNCFGSWEFSTIFAEGAKLESSTGAGSACLVWLAMLLALGALLKSAQVPFHSWLPDTMETPTPVSALMHAGIINAGGFLVIRFSSVMIHSPLALNLLAMAGAVTALFASVVMLTASNVKRSLAFSTIAQMGFMMLQCGLGAFSLAALHIVAHSLYKAHAFLSSGSVVALTKSAWTPAERPSAHPAMLVGSLATALVVTLGVGQLFQVSPDREPGVILLGSVFMMGLAYLLWNIWSVTQDRFLLWISMPLALMAAAIYYTLHWAFSVLLGNAVVHYMPERSTMEYLVIGLVLVLFVGVLLFQAQLPAWSSRPWMKRLYVQALNGFYLGQYANRWIAQLTRKPAL